MIFGWSLHVGDPDLWGWLTFANYLCAAGCAAWAARTDGKNVRFWIFVTLLMLALGINKQLDLQVLMTAAGRDLLARYDWYQDRHILQRWFVELLAAGVIAALAVLVFAGRRSGRPVLLATVGIMLSACFVVARAAAFNHMDRVLDLTFVATRLNLILENAAIACVTAGAIAAVIAPHRRKQRRPLAG